MKKLLLCSMVALAAFGINAQTSFTYGICTDNINGVGTNIAGTNYSAAIEVPEEVAKAMQGSRLTAVTVGFNSGLSKDATIYLTYDLKGEPFYTQPETKFLKAKNFTTATLDTPYEIEGRKFYIGYTYRQTRSNDKPIAFDAEALDGVSLFSHLGIWPDGGTPEWDVFPSFGSVCIRCIIEGDNLPSNALLPLRLSLPKSVGVNVDFNYSVDVYNISSSPVSSVSLSAAFGSDNPILSTVALDNVIEPMGKATVALKGRTSQENSELPVSLSISGVNGADNLLASVVASTKVLASDFVKPRIVVIEEGTGTGCGWCPAGYVAMEHMRENYPDTYLGIAVHNYPGDPMNCSSYSEWVDMYGAGYPYASINRSGSYGTFTPNLTICEAYYKELEGVVDLDLKVSAELADESGESIFVRTTARFGNDVESHNYGIAIVQTEDNVGPYSQNNYYSGGKNGNMYGWENKPGSVQVMYNDVARRIDNWNGKDVFPASLSRGQEYVYDETVPVGSPQCQKIEDTTVAALLIDRSTGEIVTAAKCRVGEKSSTGDVMAYTSSVRALPGAISVEGDFTTAEIYRPDGSKAATLSRAGRVELPTGIYIVSVFEFGRVSTIKLIVK